jgi:hypothetical protein
MKTPAGRPVTRADIYSFCDGFIERPPVPARFEEAFNQTLLSVQGVPKTIADYYREESLTPSLNRIAEAATLSMQRSACIKEMAAQIVWRTMYVCLSNAKTEFGKETILKKFRKEFGNSERNYLSFLASGFYLISITTYACLDALGTALLGLDEVTDSQIRWCRSYAEEIMMLDVGIMDVIWTNSKGDRQHAEQLAAWKDDNLTPILSRMDRLLEATKNDVIRGTFDLDRFMRKSQALEAETSRLASTLR